MKIKYKALVLPMLAAACCQARVVISDGSDEGQDCFVVKTESATYYYQKSAGGFSSIHDRDGVDWIQYSTSGKAAYPESAASEYRGLPNMVYGSSDSGAGHPGFDKCISILVDDHTIRSFSKSGHWQWSWEFSDNFAILTVEQVDPDDAYWFLYEGPIGGTFDPANQYWGNSRNGPIREFSDYFKKGGGGIYDQWDWAYFGDDRINRIFFVQQIDTDDLPDTMGYLGASADGLASEDGMVVFGFGRYKQAKPVMTKTPTRFRIGFIENKVDSPEEHDAVAAMLSGYSE